MELVKYDAMVNAIAICESVDEVKDIRDKAIALEVYAKQAKNFDAERKCATVRVRAERQVGVMLAGMEKDRGGDKKSTCRAGKVDSEYKQAKDSPPSPSGLYGGDLSKLIACEHHRHSNWGKSGMVYWEIGSLTKLAEYPLTN